MSDIPADFPPIDLREQLVRIDREMAEAQKLGWDARFAPYLAFAAVIGGLLGVASFIAHLMGH